MVPSRAQIDAFRSPNPTPVLTAEYHNEKPFVLEFIKEARKKGIKVSYVHEMSGNKNFYKHKIHQRLPFCQISHF